MAQLQDKNKVTRITPDGGLEIIEGRQAFDEVTQRKNLDALQRTNEAVSALDFAIENITPETFGLVARGQALLQKVSDVFGDAFATQHTSEFEGVKEALLENDNLFENSKAARTWRKAFRASRVDAIDSVMLMLAYKIARANDRGRLSDQDFARSALVKLKTIRDLLLKGASGYGVLLNKPVSELRGFFPQLFPVSSPASPTLEQAGQVTPVPSPALGTQGQIGQEQSQAIADQIRRELGIGQ